MTKQIYLDFYYVCYERVSATGAAASGETGYGTLVLLTTRTHIIPGYLPLNIRILIFYNLLTYLKCLTVL